MMNKYPPTWECYRLPGTSKPDEWKVTLERCLGIVESPYRYDIHNTSLRIWNHTEPEIKSPNGDYTCRNGYELQKVAFGNAKDETLVGITCSRLLFEPGSKRPTSFSADEFFSKGEYPEVLRHQPMIGGISRLIEFLNQSLVGKQLERHQTYTVAYQAENILYQFGNRSYTLAQIVQNPGLSKNLLNAVRANSAVVPASIRLGVLSASVRASNIAMHIGREIASVLQNWHCMASIEDLKSGDGIDTFLADFSVGQPIILVPLDGKKGDRPPDFIIDRLKYLNTEKAAFQLYSVSSDPRYIRHGLAIAVLAKANGSLFIAKPKDLLNFQRNWFVGLDLGKGRLNKGKVVVITLTNPDGSLQGYWRALKDEDETLSPKVLHEGLSWIVSEADALDAGRPLYLIRDGRRPHNESLNLYYEALPNHNFTLIEYSKSGTPLIHCASFEPEPGTTLLPEESNFTAMYPCTSPQRGVLTTPVKFCTSINPNKHTPSEVALLLTALCHSATLSYQPSRLPAPIYWADGLARLSFNDLQFSGWSHRANKLVNLRATTI